MSWYTAKFGAPRVRHLKGHRHLKGAFTKCGYAIGEKTTPTEQAFLECAVCLVEAQGPRAQLTLTVTA